MPTLTLPPMWAWPVGFPVAYMTIHIHSIYGTPSGMPIYESG